MNFFRKFIFTTLIILALAPVIPAQGAYKATVYEEWAGQGNLIEAVVMLPGLTGGIRYEMCFDYEISGAVSVCYNDFPKAIRTGIECNFYPQEHSPNAWLFGPETGIYYADDEKIKGLLFFLGVQCGYRWIFGCWSVCPRAGLEYIMGSDVIGFGYGAGASGGYAF